MPQREDFLNGMMRRIVAALAGARETRLAGQAEDALEQVQDTYGELFGIDSRMVLFLDAQALANLLGDSGKLAGMGLCMTEEAATLRQLGRLDEARRLAAKALILVREQLKKQTPFAEELRVAEAELTRSDS